MGSGNYFIFFFLMRAEKVDTGEEHFHLLSRDLSHFDFPHGPWELVVIKTLHPETESVLIPVQNLDRSPSCPAEHIKISVKRIQSMLLFHEYCQSVDLFPHIRIPGPDEDVYFVPVDSHIAPLTALITRLNSSTPISSEIIIRIPGSNETDILRRSFASVVTAMNLGLSIVPLSRLLQYWNVEYGIRSAIQKSRCVSLLRMKSRITPRQCCSLACFMFHLRAYDRRGGNGGSDGAK